MTRQVPIDQFASSPYLAVLRGEEGATYAQLEDSLANFARALAAAPKPRPGRAPATKRADGTVDPDDADTPGAVVASSSGPAAPPRTGAPTGATSAAPPQ